MKVLQTVWKYFFHCGIGKEEYKAVKKDAYVSNCVVWKILHFLMAGVFGFLFISSLFNDLLSTNRVFYLIAFVYSAIVTGLFFVMRKDSIVAQLIIYLSISLLFLFSCLITQNKPEIPATTFIVFLLLAPMFMIDRPVFMAIELIAASTVFLVWMHGVKPHYVWEMDMINVVIFTVVGIFLNIIANSVRIREFILTRKINIQKDTDDLTGLMNKGALTREIGAYMADPNNRGIMFMMDVDKFKSINDTYGHDIGDDVIVQLGTFLGRKFTGNEIAGRFGGDEFIVFIKDTDDPEIARRSAAEIVAGASENVILPSTGQKLGVSIGIAVFQGDEQDYHELFKKADTALYKAKADAANQFCFYE